MKREIVQIRDGSGRIRVAGDESECALTFDGKPVAFRWNDCQGSVAQYLIRGTRAEDYQGAVDQIRNLVRGREPLSSLAETLRPLLQMFEAGQYVLCQREAARSHVMEFSAKDDIRKHSDHYYPSGDVFICTQPREYLDEKVVSDWERFIKEGGRPLVLVGGLCRDESLFVLDGHHKLEAYRLLGIEPHIIEILLVTGRSITIWEGEQALGEATCLSTEYRKFKGDHVPYGGAERPPIPMGDSGKLFFAIEDGRLSEVASLLERDPALCRVVNEDAETPLIAASRCGNAHIAREVLKYSPDFAAEQADGITALHYAAVLGNVDVINSLLDVGCPVDLEDSSGETALLNAAAYGQMSAVKALIARGATVNPRNGSALVRAAWRGDLELTKYLLEQGADPKWNRINEYGIDAVAVGTNAACRLVQEKVR